MRKWLVGLAILAAVGCGGGGSSTPPTNPVIGTDRIVAIVEEEGRSTLVSYDLNGQNRTRHSVLDADTRVLDVAPNGRYLLIAKMGPSDREELYLASVDGREAPEVITDGEFRVIETARINADGTRVVCAGILGTGKPVVGVAEIDGTMHVLDANLYAADFLGDGRLAVAGYDAEVGATLAQLGIVDADGENPEELATAQGFYLSLDAAGTSIVATDSAGGDEDPNTRVVLVSTDGSEPRVLSSQLANYVDPRLSPEGDRVYVAKAGFGIVRMGTAPGAEESVVAEQNVIGLVTVR